MRGSSLTEKSLPLAIQKFAEDQRPVDENRQLSIFEAEKQLVIQTVEATAGNKSEAARILGITRKTLLNKLKRYSGEN